MNKASCAIYARVSTKNKQDIETQLIPLREYQQRMDKHLYSEYVDIGVSGMKSSRPNFDRLLRDMRKGKFGYILVYKLDRIGRSTAHLLNLFEEFDKRGIEFISITENIDTTTTIGRAMQKMLMIMAEFERELMIERINAGIARARKQGKHLGRPRTAIKSPNKVMRMRSKGMSIRQIANELETSVASVHRCIKREGTKKQ